VGGRGLRRSHRRKQSIARLTELADGLSSLRKNITQVLSKTFSGDLVPSPLRLSTRFSFHSPLPDVRSRDAQDTNNTRDAPAWQAESNPTSPTLSQRSPTHSSPSSPSSRSHSILPIDTDPSDPSDPTHPTHPTHPDCDESCDELMDPLEYSLFSTTPPFAGVRVLLFDQSRRVMRRTAKVLERLGCVVTVAGGYEDALGRVTAQPFDVAVVDFIPIKWLGKYSPHLNTCML
jgi:CheY-like chemotaxis protein